MPNSVCASSVRPAPIKPIRPTTSPARTVRLTSSYSPWRVRPEVSTTTGASPTSRAVTAWSNRLARHQFRQPRLGHARGVEHADQSAVAQNGDAARHVEHFREPMAHEDHGDAGRGERAHDGEQVVRLGLRERGGGLVHEDELRVARERARDRHQLSARNRQTVQRRAEIEIDAELGERGARGLAYGAVVHEPRRAHEAVERDVLGDRHFREQRQILPNHRNALARGRAAASSAATLSPK